MTDQNNTLRNDPLAVAKDMERANKREAAIKAAGKKDTDKSVPNSNADGGQYIDAVMTHSAGIENAELQFINYAYSDSVYYSAAVCKKIIDAKAADKTDLLDAILCRLSSAAKKAIDDNKVAKSVKGEKSTATQLMIGANDRKLKAAREMLKRAIYAIYGLRNSKAVRVEYLDKQRALKVVRPPTDPKAPKNELETTVEQRGKLEKAGRDLFTSKGPKKAGGPVVAPVVAIADLSQHLVNMLKPVKDITKLNDKDSKALDDLLVNLMLKQFSVDNLVNMADMQTWFGEHAKGIRIAK